MLTVLLGGARAGKSSLAERLATASGRLVTVIATGIGCDDEMRYRIARHRHDRPADWVTVEEPYDLAAALSRVPADHAVVIDCVTTWVGNLMARDDDPASIEQAVNDLLRTAATPQPIFVISNEVGMGIVPGNQMSRTYRDLLGRINQRLVAAGDQSLFVVAGRSIPLTPTAVPARRAGNTEHSLSADAARAAVVARADNVLRPPGALAAFDTVAAHFAYWQQRAQPSAERAEVLVFAGDHGVATAGVSAYPVDITAAMLAAVNQGQATINALANQLNAHVTAIDVGVGVPTGDIRVEAAMTTERFAESIAAGERAVDDAVSRAAEVIILGELGIGNTTAAAALTAHFLGGEVSGFVGRGTGIDDAGLASKVAAVEAACKRISPGCDPMEVLRQIGGAELAAIAGACRRAGELRVPVILDGYACTAAVLALHASDAEALGHCLAGHRSAEPGHRLALKYLDLEPLLRLDMRLGEGSGALAALPLVRLAIAAVTDVATFDEWFG